MLLRGRNTVGYTPYPTEVTDAFVREKVETGCLTEDAETM